MGANALDANTTGNNNTALGFQSQTGRTGGNDNVAVGAYCMNATATGDSNTGLGKSALHDLTSGATNTAVGHNAMFGMTTGDHNVAIGAQALEDNTTGTGNVAVGYDACRISTTASYNTGLGFYALRANQTGSDNTAVGYRALRYNTSNYNTAVGYEALLSNTTGNQNVAVGRGALYSNQSGVNNVAIGKHALYNCTNSGNVAVGEYAGGAVTTGDSNIFIGKNCGGITNGVHNIMFGYDYTVGNQSNLIGFNNQSQTITVSGSAGSWNFSSDGRDKTDIVNLTLGLGFINKLTPRKFRWDYRDKTRFPKGWEDDPDMLIKAGFIAQELQEVLKEENAEYTAIVDAKDPDKLQVSSTGMIPMMINAIKELSAENTALKARLDAAGL